MSRVYRFIAYHPKTTLVGVAALTLVALLGIVDVPGRTLRLKIETAIDKVLPHGSPDRVFYEDFQKRFGTDNLIYLGLVLEEGHVFTPEHLERIKDLTQRIEEMDGIHHVISLSNAADIRSVDGEVVTGSIYKEVPRDEAGLTELRNRVMANPLHAGNLVSEDGQAVAFLVYPNEMSEREFRRREIDLAIERVGNEMAPPGAKVLLAGGPPIKAETSRTLLRDLLTFVPAGYLLMGIVGWLAFRSVRGVVLPLSAISFGIVWTFSAIAVSGRSLNLVTFIVPGLIQAVGFAYAVHVVSEHDDVLREGETGQKGVFQALQQVAFPVLLTAATTAAGFMSLTLNRIPAIREFGAFCTVGVVSCMIASLTFVPAILSLITDPQVRPQPSEGGIERWAARIARFDIRHRTPVLLAAACVALAAGFGLTRIQIGTSFVDNLMDDHPLRLAIETFDERLTGSMTIHLVLNADEENAFKDPSNLKALREYQDWLESQPEVGTTTSLADYVMTVNRAFNDGDPEAFEVPDSRSLIGQYFFFFWTDSLESLVDSHFAATDIQIRGPYLNSNDAVQLLERQVIRASTD